jgi:hypothetical protein
MYFAGKDIVPIMEIKPRFMSLVGKRFFLMRVAIISSHVVMIGVPCFLELYFGFLHGYSVALQKFGLVYENTNVRWASPVVVVKKPIGYRICVDLRAVNVLSIATA